VNQPSVAPIRPWCRWLILVTISFVCYGTAADHFNVSPDSNPSEKIGSTTIDERLSVET